MVCKVKGRCNNAINPFGAGWKHMSRRNKIKSTGTVDKLIGYTCGRSVSSNKLLITASCSASHAFTEVSEECMNQPRVWTLKFRKMVWKKEGLKAWRQVGNRVSGIDGGAINNTIALIDGMGLEFQPQG